MTLVQDTRWAYSTLPRPHGSDKQTFIWTLSIAHHNIIVLQSTHKFSVSYRSVTKKFMINLDFLQLNINFTIISSANDTYQQMSLTHILLYHFELQSCKSISFKHPVSMRSGLAAGWRVWRAFLVFFRRISVTRLLMTVIFSLCCFSNIVFISMRCFTCSCCTATCCSISWSSFTSSFSFVEAGCIRLRCPLSLRDWCVVSDYRRCQYTCPDIMRQLRLLSVPSDAVEPSPSPLQPPWLILAKQPFYLLIYRSLPISHTLTAWRSTTKQSVATPPTQSP